MVAVQIESFAENTLEFLRREHELLTHGIPAPEMETDMQDRHVLVVVRGYHYVRTSRPAAVHPRVQAGDGGRRRRCGRPDRGRYQPTPSSVTWTQCLTSAVLRR